jgi:hypothetical protein
LLTSTTACQKRLVMVEGEQTITVKKSTLDTLYQDNELLIKALEECKGKP